MFGSSSVNVGFGLVRIFSSVELETCLHDGHLLQIFVWMYSQFHLVKNWVRTVTFGFRFCLVLGKTWVLVWFVCVSSFPSLMCLFMCCMFVKCLQCRILRRCRLLPAACWWVGCRDASLSLTGITTATRFLLLSSVLIIHLSLYTDGEFILFL